MENNYLENFKSLLNLVQSTYKDATFLQPDLQTYQDFLSMKEGTQYLYVRIFLRKFKWHSLESVKYKEIHNFDESYRTLMDKKFILTENNLNDIDDCLNLITTGNISKLAKELKIPANQSKNKSLVKKFIVNLQRQATKMNIFKQNKESNILKLLIKYSGNCCKLNSNIKNSFSRLFVLVAPSQLQEGPLNISEFFSDFIRSRFMKYKMTAKSQPFATREVFVEYCDCLFLEVELLEEIKKQNWTGAVKYVEKVYNILEKSKNCENSSGQNLPDFLNFFTVVFVAVRIMEAGIVAFAKLKKFSSEVFYLEFLLLSQKAIVWHRGRWWQRLVLLYQRYLKDPHKASHAAVSALLDPYVLTDKKYWLCNRGLDLFPAETSRLAIEENIPRVICPKKLSIQRPSLTSSLIPSSKKTIFVNSKMVPVSVEESVLEYFKINFGYKFGIHGEGVIFTTLTGLIFFKEIWACFDDVFISPAQNRPLDAFSPSFGERRSYLLNDRLEWMKICQIDELINHVGEIWDLYYGTTCYMINWEILGDKGVLASLLRAFPRSGLTAILERIIRCYKWSRGGLPDLCLWREDCLGVRLVEVKAPGDVLSDKQIIWMDFLGRLGDVGCEVCYVNH